MQINYKYIFIIIGAYTQNIKVTSNWLKSWKKHFGIYRFMLDYNLTEFL